MQIRTNHAAAATVAGLLAAMTFTTGCENLPGNEKQQGAVIGGATGAAVGAAVTDNRLLGGLIGGALGAGGGYLIGANWDKIQGNERDDAHEAIRKSQNEPATAQEARSANTADINNDGFVTIDEVVAMEKAGFSDEEMIDKLERTGQVFDLTQANEDQLRDQGVSRRVVAAMRDMNRTGDFDRRTRDDDFRRDRDWDRDRY
ncbi:MAG TPA: glycine zipper domain-containing protein [Phycisphaerales bacterium]|nr:glycine zipper domain-containing protein [Phycisphaerales bacterium]